jgi:putative salt-induced outer membrane protein YdiY
MLAVSGIAVCDEEDTGWTTSVDLSLVVTDGNSQSETLGFSNVTKRIWDKGELRFKANAVRSETADDRFVIINPGVTFLPGETPAGPFDTTTIEPGTEPDVEKYFFETRYDRQIADRFYWHVGAGWDRNEDAGILDRYIGFAGLGNVWWDREDLKFRTSYGLSYTDREEEDPDPEKDDTFTGARFEWEYLNKLGKVAVYQNDFTANVSVEETSDYSLDMTNSVSVDLSKRLAMKVGLQWLYEAEPALEDVDLIAPVNLIDPDGTPGSGDEFFETVSSGGTEIVIGEESIEKDELDTIFRASLVITF